MNSQICLRDEHSAVSVNFPQVKCDFCDITLRCDLDVSRHLVSDDHRKNLDEFLSLQNVLSKDVQKELPKNLSGLFKSLKLKQVKDLKDLADKGFFEIIDEPIAEIAEELATTLIHTVIDYESRSLRPSERKVILDALKEENPPEAPRASIQSRVTQQPAPSPRKLSSQTSTAKPKAEKSETIPVTSVAAPVLSAQRSKSASSSKKTPPKQATQPAPSLPGKSSKSTPSKKQPKDKSQTNQIAPAMSAGAAVLSKAARSKSKTNRPLIGPASVTRPATAQTQRTSNLTPNPRPKPTSSSHTQSTNLIRVPETNSNSVRPSTSTSNSTSTSSNSLPTVRIPPKPRLDTDYIPKLAIIKTEPK